MKFALYTVPSPSHIGVMSALAKELAHFGHTSCAIGLEDLAPELYKKGIEFIPVCSQEFPFGEITRRYQPLRHLFGLEALKYVVSVAYDVGISLLNDGERAIRLPGADALILDTSARGCELIAMRMNLPFVHLSATVHEDRTGMTPIYCYDWPPEKGSEAFARTLGRPKSFERTCCAWNGCDPQIY